MLEPKPTKFIKSRKLKPCPLCSRQAMLIVYAWGGVNVSCGVDDGIEENEENEPDSCGLILYCKSKQEAIERWNSRALKSDSARLIHDANIKCFRLRAMVLDEKMRVEKTADVVEWNALTRMTELSKELSDMLVKVAKLESSAQPFA